MKRSIKRVIVYIMIAVLLSALIIAFMWASLIFSLQDVQNFLSSLVSIAGQIILLFFIILIALWFAGLVMTVLRGARHLSLSILPVTNETGIKDLDGLTQGIDDLLISQLREIRKIGQIEEAWHSRLIKGDRLLSKIMGEEERSDPYGGPVAPRDRISGADSFVQEIQKSGEISIGNIKIPLGTIMAFFSRLVGGNYISGSLQKHGDILKIILHLENRPPIFNKLFAQPESYYAHSFKLQWSVKGTSINDLSRGIPSAVEEVAWEVSLPLAGDIGTEKWLAYKHFLNGLDSYSNFEKNDTRVDFLQDAISCWRKSINLDESFARAHYNLGLALDINKEYAHSVYHFFKAVELSTELGASAHYSLARLFWTHGDDKQALNKIKEAMIMLPERPDAYFLEGSIYFDLGEFEKAVASYKKALRYTKDTSNYWLYYNLSAVYYRLGNYEAAENYGNRAMEACWDHLTVKVYGRTAHLNKEDKIRAIAKRERWFALNFLQSMGQIYLDKQYFDEAKIFFQEGLKISVEDLLDQKKDKRALARSHGYESRDMLEGYAGALRGSGDLEEALRIQRRLVRLWPEYPAGYQQLAEIMCEINRFSQAEIKAYDLLCKALKRLEVTKDKDKNTIEEALRSINGSSVKLSIFKGALGLILHYVFGDNKDADVYFKQAAGEANVGYVLQPENHHVHGYVLYDLGDYKKAIKVFREAIVGYEDGQYYGKGKCYEYMARSYQEIKGYQKSCEAFTKAADFYKQIGYLSLVSKTYIKKAECLIERYDQHKNADFLEKARIECENAILVNHKNYRAFLVKGKTFYIQEKYLEAISDYEETLEINYNLPTVHYKLGVCYFMVEDYGQAEREFKAIIKIDESFADPDDQDKPDPYQWLAKCLEKQNKTNEIPKFLKIARNRFMFSQKYRKLYDTYQKYSILRSA